MGPKKGPKMALFPKNPKKHPFLAVFGPKLPSKSVFLTMSPGPLAGNFPIFATQAPLKTFRKTRCAEMALFELMRGACLPILHFSQKEPRTARGHLITTYIKKWSIEAHPRGGLFGPFLGGVQIGVDFGRFSSILPLFDPLCAPQIIFGKIPPLEMLFRCDWLVFSDTVINYTHPLFRSRTSPTPRETVALPGSRWALLG